MSTTQADSFEKPLKKLDDFAGRYFVLSGCTYVRLTFMLAYNGRSEEVERIDEAERIAKENGIQYDYPRVSDDVRKIPRSAIISADLKTATDVLRHYGYEIKEKKVA